jgi:hypothetical protein
MKRMNGVMQSGLVETLRDPRQKGFVDEKLHAASIHERPDWRPMGGCDRA